MQAGNPYCQMCRKELCVVCKQKLDQCKCPCPNFVICRYCEAHEKTMPPCDEMFPSNNAEFSLGGGFGGGGPTGKIMPLMMMMMMFMNKQNAGRSCLCNEHNRSRKDSHHSPKRDRERSPKSSHPCCCKVQNAPVQPQLVPIIQPVRQYQCPQGCCSCSSKGDAHTDKSREPINQYFFGPDCNHQPAPHPQPAPYPQPVSYPQQGPHQPPESYPQGPAYLPLGAYPDRGTGNQPQETNEPPRQALNQIGKPKSPRTSLGYSPVRHKPVNKNNSIVTNKF